MAYTYLLITCLLITLLPAPVFAGDKSVNAVEKRITPVGQVRLTSEKAVALAAKSTMHPPGAGRAGKTIYTKHCAICHAAGIAGAPRLGDKAAWTPRKQKGKKALIASVMKGLNTMPAMGGCMDCSEEEIESAIDYMIHH